jgi:hypothetical protein
MRRILHRTSGKKSMRHSYCWGLSNEYGIASNQGESWADPHRRLFVVATRYFFVPFFVAGFSNGSDFVGRPRGRFPLGGGLSDAAAKASHLTPSAVASV